MVLVRSVYSLQYFTGLHDITTMSWIISLNDSHVLFNLKSRNDCHSVITDRNDTMTVLACCKIQRNTCHQMASLAFRLHKIQFRPGLRTGPRWGNLRRSPKPPSRLGRGIPPPQSPEIADVITCDKCFGDRWAVLLQGLQSDRRILMHLYKTVPQCFLTSQHPKKTTLRIPDAPNYLSWIPVGLTS